MHVTVIHAEIAAQIKSRSQGVERLLREGKKTLEECVEESVEDIKNKGLQMCFRRMLLTKFRPVRPPLPQAPLKTPPRMLVGARSHQKRLELTLPRGDR